MIVQIYEIQTPQEAELCIAAGVNRLGSVLLTEDAWHDPGVKAVGDVSREAGVPHSVIPLFRSPERIFRALEFHAPACVHFCENLTDGRALSPHLGALVELQAQLKRRFPQIAVVRAIPIPAQELALPAFPWREIAAAFAPVSDLFLIDTWVPDHLSPVPEFVGITGKLADRERCRALVRESELPVILAGGLSPENVYDAVLEVAPAGADSCTRTNRLDATGRPLRFAKDLHKVSRFVAETLRAARDLASARAAPAARD